jgi:hypothetical protein
VSKGLSIALCRIWAGLECGLWGAVALAGWLTLHSLLRGEFWWAKFNVAASVFFGDAVFGMGASRATIAGVALFLVVYSALGALYGLVARTRGFARNLVLATLVAMAWHLVAHRFLWRWVNPFAPPYFPPYSMLAGHLVFGLLLSRFAGRFQAIAGVFIEPAPESGAEPREIDLPDSPPPASESPT